MRQLSIDNGVAPNIGMHKVLRSCCIDGPSYVVPMPTGHVADAIARQLPVIPLAPYFYRLVFAHRFFRFGFSASVFARLLASAQSAMARTCRRCAAGTRIEYSTRRRMA